MNLKQLDSPNVASTDVHFYQPGPVQLLLSAIVYEDLFLDKRSGNKGGTFEMRFQAEWLLMPHVRAYQCLSFQDTVELGFARFWEVQAIYQVRLVF